MNDQPYLTAAGLSKIKAELSELKGPQRAQIAQRLRSAVQQGDLSENADYHKAKEDQAFLEGKIQELEYLLENAIIIDELEHEPDQVYIGGTVTIEDEEGIRDTYHLVGAKESDPGNGKISNESPIGQALIGHKVDELVTVETPAGVIKLKIVNIQGKQ